MHLEGRWQTRPKVTAKWLTLLYIREVPVQTLARKPTVLDAVSRGIVQSSSQTPG
jgi:hypothetical protein